MSSFFEKLKKGMETEVEIPSEKEKPKPIQKKVGGEKMEIKTSPIEPVESEPEKEAKKLSLSSVSVKASVLSSEADDSQQKRESKKKWFEPEGELAVDVYQTDEELVIQSAIAGVKPEELDISIENDVVIIRGNRKKPEEKGERNYFYQECYWGLFSRQIIAPEEIDPSRVQAFTKEGILTIRIPKIERKKKRKIEVKE